MVIYDNEWIKMMLQNAYLMQNNKTNNQNNSNVNANGYVWYEIFRISICSNFTEHKVLRLNK